MLDNHGQKHPSSSPSAVMVGATRREKGVEVGRRRQAAEGKDVSCLVIFY